MRRRTIGQLAAELGISVETVRYYERRGLIPQPKTSAGGYRHYGDELVAAIRYIRLAQDLGLSLREIAALQTRLDGGPAFCAAVRETVRSRLARVSEQIAELERLRTELNAFLDRCSSRDAQLPCPIAFELRDLERAVNPRQHYRKED